MLALLVEAAARSLLLAALVWAGCRLFRAGPGAELAAWSSVLMASLAMPVLMHWSPDIAAPLAVSLPASFTEASAPLPEIAVDAASAPATPAGTSFSLSLLAAAAYALIAAAMLVRLGIGMLLAVRLRRAAEPLPESALHGLDIRCSDGLSAPVTFASTILVPRDFETWPDFKRAAVLAHEAAHLARGDFYVLALAAMNRAVFWFSPLSWWLHDRLAMLAENMSDAAAVAEVGEAPDYAEVLLDMAARGAGLAVAIPMARPHTVARRIERILTQTEVPSMSRTKHLLVFASLLPLVAISACVQVSAAQNAASSSALAGQARTVEPFHAVSFSGSGAMDITAGKTQGVALEGSDELLSRITTEVRDGTLYIGRKSDRGMDFGISKDQLKVHITVPTIDGVRLSGSGDIALAGLAGGATNVKISGSGNLAAHGRLDQLNLDISGSGRADMPDLTVEDAAVKVSGSGNVRVKVQKSLEANVSGSGNIRYIGSPGRVNSHISGSGRVDQAS